MLLHSTSAAVLRSSHPFVLLLWKYLSQWSKIKVPTRLMSNKSCYCLQIGASCGRVLQWHVDKKVLTLTLVLMRGWCHLGDIVNFQRLQSKQNYKSEIKVTISLTTLDVKFIKRLQGHQRLSFTYLPYSFACFSLQERKYTYLVSVLKHWDAIIFRSNIPCIIQSR